MGIRIHKALAYGFKYARLGEDPRFNNIVWNNDGENIKSKLIDFCRKEDEGKDFLDKKYCFFTAWLEGVGLYSDKPAPDHLSLSDFIIDDFGYKIEGDIGPIGFGCYEMDKDWYRYDDIIDYIEETGGNMETKIKYIKDEAGQPAGIYPNISYVNRKTGGNVKCYPADRWMLTPALLGAKKKNNPELGKNFEEKYGVQTLIEWQRDIVPRPPEGVLAVCNCFNIFKNPMTVYRLKPFLMTWWN